MKHSMIVHSAKIFLSTMLCALAGVTVAQTYPARPIRLVVGFAAGGPTDVAARMVQGKLGEALGQAVIVDNRPGASGVLGADIVAKTLPDGHTLLVCNSSILVTNKLLIAQLPYDPVRDFAPVSMLLRIPYVLLVHQSVPAKTVRELVAASTARPGSINYGSSGVATTSHLGAELFIAATGARMNHVPYKGASAARTELLGGHIQVLFEGVFDVLQHIRSGRLRGLAVAALKPSVLAPELPTLHDSGVPGFELSTWQGVCAPAAVPRAVLARLHQAIVAALASPEVRERLASVGAEAVGNTPEEFSAYQRTELERWARVIQAAGIKAQQP